MIIYRKCALSFTKSVHFVQFLLHKMLHFQVLMFVKIFSEKLQNILIIFLEVIGLSNPYFRCFKYLAVALVKSVLINQLKNFSKFKADWEFLLYPVCLGLIFYSCFYAKISPSMPDLSAWYDECASGLMLSTRCFIWNIGSALEECLLKAFLSERSIASNISTFNSSNWDEIVRAFHFANLTNIHTIQLFKVNSISTLMISLFSRIWLGNIRKLTFGQ